MLDIMLDIKYHKEMKYITSVLAAVLFLIPSSSFAAALTTDQATSLIGVVQSSPQTPANAFIGLITAFSNITDVQAMSLISVVQSAPGVPAISFINLLVSFTQDTVVNTPIEAPMQSKASVTPQNDVIQAPIAPSDTTSPIVIASSQLGYIADLSGIKYRIVTNEPLDIVNTKVLLCVIQDSNVPCPTSAFTFEQPTFINALVVNANGGCYGPSCDTYRNDFVISTSTVPNGTSAKNITFVFYDEAHNLVKWVEQGY